MRKLALLSVALITFASLAACGGDKPPATPANAPDDDPTPKWEGGGAGGGGSGSSAPSSSSGGATQIGDGANGGAPADGQTVPRKQRPLALHNACTETVQLVYGEDAKAGKPFTMAPQADSEGVRDKDGNATIWLLDEKGAPLVNVHVTRGMKRVEVGRSCRSLDAR